MVILKVLKEQDPYYTFTYKSSLLFKHKLCGVLTLFVVHIPHGEQKAIPSLLFGNLREQKSSTFYD